MNPRLIIRVIFSFATRRQFGEAATKAVALPERSSADRRHPHQTLELTIRLRLIAVSALLLLAACDRSAAEGAQAGGKNAPPLRTPANLAASDFLDGVLGDEMFEVRSAEVAAARANSPAVKAFAVKMARDHAASTAELNAAIAGAGQNLAAPNGMSAHLQSLLDQLNRGTASNFDKTYIEQQVEADQEALKPMSAYAKDGGVPSIKAAANHLAPIIQAHLDQARSLEEALSKTS
jgi:putative membrane protein